jgi:hypothetical protein
MEKATEFLQKFNEWIQDATLFSYIFKWISGAWIKGLYKLASGIEGIIDQVFKVFDFLNNGTIGTIYDGMRILSLTVLVIMIIVLAYKYIMNERVDLKSGLFRAALFMCLGIQLPGMITSAVELSQTVYGETKALDTKDNKEQKTLSYSIVKENLTDLQYISQKGFSTLTNEAGAKRNALTENVFMATDLTQVITPDSLGTMKKDANNEDDVSYLEYKLVTAPDGKLTSEKIESGGIFNFFQEGKFRFQYHTGTISISLITVSFAFICSAFIIASSLIELVFAKLMFPVLSVSDIETGQRTKKVLLDIGSSLLSIMLTGFSLSIFKLYFSYIGTLKLSFLPYFILCIAGARIVLDGPKFFGKFLGLDIGLRSGWQAMLGTAVAAKTAANVAKPMQKNSGNKENTTSRAKVNNGVHESTNDKSIQNRSSTSGSSGASRNSLQDFTTNFRKTFGTQDQLEAVTESVGANRTTVSEPKESPSVQDNVQVSSNSGFDPSSTVPQSRIGATEPNTYGSTDTTRTTDAEGNANGKSISNVPTDTLNQMGESGNRIESTIDPINGNRAKNLASGKTSTAQKIQRTTIPPLTTPSKSPTIQTAVEKGKAADQSQRLSNPTVSGGNSSTSSQRTNDQAVKRSTPETTYGTSTSGIVQKNSQSAANAGNKTMPQTPSRGLDQSIATPRKQNVPESTTRKQTSQKATASNYQVPTLESKIKEPSSPEEVAHKLLTESSVKPDNSYYDIYQSMDKVKAEDFI